MVRPTVIPNEEQLFESIKTKLLNESRELKSQSDLMTGLILGLLLGIIGNLFVQFFYAVIERLTLSVFDNMFLVGLAFSLGSIAGILLITWAFRRKMRAYAVKQAELQSLIASVEDKIKVIHGATEIRS
jgi:hypothetical protein